MKNKKSLLVLGIFALVLVLGVGYAVVGGVTLTIGGSASTAESNMVVKFTGTPTTGGVGTTTATITDDKTATIEVTGLTAIGDTATATYTIINEESDLAADLAVTTSEGNDFFDVSSTLAANNIQPGKETTVTVTVTVKKLPIETDESKIDITATIEATPVQPTASN